MLIRDEVETRVIVSADEGSWQVNEQPEDTCVSPLDSLNIKRMCVGHWCTATEQGEAVWRPYPAMMCSLCMADPSKYTEEQWFFMTGGSDPRDPNIAYRELVEVGYVDKLEKKIAELEAERDEARKWAIEFRGRNKDKVKQLILEEEHRRYLENTLRKRSQRITELEQRLSHLLVVAVKALAVIELHAPNADVRDDLQALIDKELDGMSKREWEALHSGYQTPPEFLKGWGGR
jgi:hypothetical protein